MEAGFATVVDIEMKDIAELKKCNVGLIIPTGVDVILKNGKKYRLSVLKRDEKIAMIQNHM